MPKTNRPPTYRLHKARNCAVVTIDGKNHYLGPYGSPESHEKYARLIAEWRLNAKHLLPTTGRRPGRPDAVGQRADPGLLPARPGATTSRTAGPPASRTTSARPCGSSASSTARPRPCDFGPVALKNVRQAMIEAGRSRKLINKDVNRIRRHVRLGRRARAAARRGPPGPAAGQGAARRAARRPGRPPRSSRSPRRRSGRSCPTSRPRSPRWSSSST